MSEAEQHVAAAPAPSIPSHPDAKPIDPAAAAATATAVSASNPPPKTKPSTINTIAKAAPPTIDAFLARLLRCLESRAGADTVLFFLAYSTRLTGALIETSSRAILRQSSQRLVALATNIPAKATVTFTKPLGATPTATLAVAAIGFAAKLKAFAGLVTDVRTFGRLWGLLGLYFAAKRFLTTSIAAPKKDGEKAAAQDFNSSSIGTAFAALKLVTIIFFQATENITYLAGKNIIPLAPATNRKLMGYSVRAFAAWVHIEVARAIIERGLRLSSLSAAEKDAETNKAWDAAWTRDFFRNLAWSPLTLNWSYDLGPFALNDLAIGALGLYPATGQLRDLWRSKA